MSPRSEELLASAEERLAGARDLLVTGHPETSAAVAYYAMLYAARAALSERGLNAKTHRGTWAIFRESFVATGLLQRRVVRGGPASPEAAGGRGLRCGRRRER